MTLSCIHSICKTQWHKRTRKHKTLQIFTSLHDRNMRNEKKGRGADSGLCVTLHIHACSSYNHIISLMHQPNTDTDPNKPLYYHIPNFWYVTRSWDPSTLSQYGVTLRSNTSVYIA
jgi:hypothetical protein